MRKEIHFLLVSDILLLNGGFDLTPGHTEDEIRNELVEVFKAKISTIRKTDFDVVKREKNVVTLSLARQLLKVDKKKKIICNNVSISVNKNKHKYNMSDFLLNIYVAI